MHHICFTMRVEPTHLERYERMHREAWPELLVALSDAGWTNYGLFLRDDGFLVGHLEAADWPTARAAMDASEVSARWSEEMDRLVVPGTSMRWLRAGEADGGRPLGVNPAVAVGTAASGSFPAGLRYATFHDEVTGDVVAYAEVPAAARGAVTDLLADPDPRPFRRVFDLERQLAELTGGHR